MVDAAVVVVLVLVVDTDGDGMVAVMAAAVAPPAMATVNVSDEFANCPCCGRNSTRRRNCWSGKNATFTRCEQSRTGSKSTQALKSLMPLTWVVLSRIVVSIVGVEYVAAVVGACGGVAVWRLGHGRCCPPASGNNSTLADNNKSQ